ncbi:O-antigen ligase [Bradyrhizobium sp. WSM1417]|uniref:O-antigen ligase family protein n=1 Tax=Bradyrhizobium sp. WSM1417 TaxID=754500 RepID=UPI000482FEED|nr:O-antigen ligase family protein [Bradyrhizobium sp. WSM1417]
MLHNISLPKLLERRDLLGAFAFAVAAISGKLSATRFMGEVFPPWLLEVRLWTTIVAVILLLPFARLIDWNRWNSFSFCGVFVLIVYLILRAPFGAADLTARKVVDLIYLIILCYLAVIVASDAARYKICGATVLIVSGALFLLALTGVAANPELNGLGWAAVGGPLTFYRLEFLGFSCALWMILHNKCHLAFGSMLLGVFLFATLASLSKAAYGAAAIAILVLTAGLIAQRNWRTLTMLVTISIFVFLGWHEFLASKFYMRANTAFASQQTAPTESDLAQIEKRYQLVVPSNKTKSALHEPGITESEKGAAAGHFLAPGFSFSTEFRWCVLDDQNGGEKARVTCHERTLIDQSQRLFFLFKALEQPTLFGHGIANFRVLALNPGAGYRLEQYNYPHNIILELLYDSGIVGVGLLVVALVFALAGFFRFVGREPALLAIGGFGLFMFISALAGGDFYDFRLFWLVALMWSTYAGAWSQDALLMQATNKEHLA